MLPYTISYSRLITYIRIILICHNSPPSSCHVFDCRSNLVSYHSSSCILPRIHVSFRVSSVIIFIICAFPFHSLLLCPCRVFAFHPFSWLVSLSLHHYHRRFRQHLHHFRRHVSPTRLELRVCLIAEQCALRLNQPMHNRRSTERFESVDLSAKYLRKWKRLASHMMVKAWSMSQCANLIAWLRWYRQDEAANLTYLANC